MSLRVLWCGVRAGGRDRLDFGDASPATVTKPPAGFTKTIVLWPNGAPGALGNWRRGCAENVCLSGDGRRESIRR